MIAMLSCFVGIRQVYLYLATRLIANTPTVVALGYPVGWATCCVTEVTYYLIRRHRRLKSAKASEIKAAEE